MPGKTIPEVLEKFNESDYTVKLCGAIFGVVPGMQPFRFYNTIEGAAARLAGGEESVLEKAREIASNPDVQTAVWVADAIDKADMGLSVVSGVKNILSLFGGSKQASTFESDPQQAADSVMKAAAMAYMIHKLFPGEIAGKISLFREIPAGNELAIYYAMAEVALPFTDNLVAGGASLISNLFNRHNREMSQKFSAVVGGDAMKDAGGVLEKFQGPLGEYVDRAKGHTGTVMQRVSSFLPSASTVGNIADSATGAAATAMDIMPVWRFLGSRLAAEACVLRAMKGTG